MKNRTFILLLLFVLVNIVLSESVIKHREPNDDVNPHSFYRKNSRESIEDINPHSFYYNKKTKTENEPKLYHTHKDVNEFVSTWKNNNNTCTEHLDKLMQHQNEQANYKIYYNRLLQMLLTHTFIAKKDDNFVEGIIGIEASVEEFNILRNYENGNTTLKKIDQILNKIVVLPRQSFFAKILINLTPVLNYCQENQFKFYLTVAFLILLFVMWKFCSTGMNMFIFIIICLISQSWYITHQDMEIEVITKQKTDQLLYEKTPASCFPEKQWWYEKTPIYQFIFAQSSSKDCQNYVKAHLSPRQTEVTLLMSFSKMCTRFIMQPLIEYASILSKVMENLTSEMNFVTANIVKIMIILAHFIIPLVFILLMLGKTTIITPFGYFRYERKSHQLPQRIETCSHNVPRLKGKEPKSIKHKYQSESEDECSRRKKKIRKERGKQLSLKKREQSESESDDSKYYDGSDSDNNDTSVCNDTSCKKLCLKRSRDLPSSSTQRLKNDNGEKTEMTSKNLNEGK